MSLKIYCSLFKDIDGRIEYDKEDRKGEVGYHVCTLSIHGKTCKGILEKYPSGTEVVALTRKVNAHDIESMYDVIDEIEENMLDHEKMSEESRMLLRRAAMYGYVVWASYVAIFYGMWKISHAGLTTFATMLWCFIIILLPIVVHRKKRII